jgi:hypothetical protein
LVQFVYSGPTELEVEAVVRVLDVGTDILGNAIVAMGDCNGDEVIGVTGGGNSGGVQAFNGGIFMNASDDDSCCAFAPPNNGFGITSDTSITGIADCDYAGESMMSPVPINTDFNKGKKVSDPLAGLPEPTCDGPGTRTGDNFTPGSYDGSDFDTNNHHLTLEPGIYCISGQISFNGNDSMSGTGVVLYFTSTGSTRFTGNGGLSISAPTDANCLEDGDGIPETNESCTYKGIAVFISRSNTNTFDVRGNGDNFVEGLFYGINATVQAKGGGTNPDETTILGQLIVKKIIGNGNGSFKVTFDDTRTFDVPPILELVQ